MGARRGWPSALAFLLLLTSLCTVSLSVANAFYQEVKAGRQRELRMSIWRLFGNEVDEGGFDRAFAAAVSVKEERKSTYYLYEPGRKAALHAIGPGLWGDIELLVVLDYGRKVIMGVQVLSQVETPGLGARIAERSFLDQFRNLDYSDSIRIDRERGGKPGQVEAVAGATKTSKSLEAIMNASLRELSSMLGKE